MAQIIVTESSAFHIPVVDFSRYRFTTSPAQKHDTAKEIVAAFKDIGFVYLSGHGIPETTIEGVFKKVWTLVELP